MRVLIIGEMSRELAQLGQMALARGVKLQQLDDSRSGLAKLRADGGFELVFCDIRQDVPALLRALQDERIASPVIACGPGNAAQDALDAVRAGARDYLTLPADPALLAALLDAASGQSHALLAGDPLMLAAVRRAEQIAPSDASVLISGESGTGKEILARHIHRRSKRAGGPFVAVNCSAIPEALLESELFGHEKGAFTGALARRTGKFEAAEFGTLLLDEISEMDIRLQAKLLRAVQEREIDRVGGHGPVKINVRILATTNRDLSAEVAGGRFREDLFFRLNVVSLRIPALRERPGDIAPLADRFIQRYSEVNGLRPRPLSPRALAKLQAHGWRGNVRELENTMHRAVLLSWGSEIDAGDIEFEGASALPSIAPAAVSGPSPALAGRRLEDVERELILTTLQHTAGNRTHAATLLGISIRTLRNKLRDYTAAGEPVTPPAAGVAA